MMEYKYGKKAKASKLKEVNLEKSETKLETHVGPSIGTSVTGKSI